MYADRGEWTRKGAVLSEGMAQNEYGVSREFILRGIRSGQLEFREGSASSKLQRLSSRWANANNFRS
jgi:hypothetical protein